MESVCLGLILSQGRGRGVVIATGTQTEFGVIFSMMQDVGFCGTLDQEHAQLLDRLRKNVRLFS